MRLRLPVKAALAALGVVNGVTAARTTIPILGCTRIDANAAEVTFTASDLDREARARADARVETPGAACVPTRMLFDIVRNLPKDGEMSFELREGVARVVAGRSRFTLPVLPAADFPTMAAGGEANSIDFDAAELARVLEAVTPAISTEETRYYLNGVYIHAHEKTLRFVATDGHKLMRWQARDEIEGEIASVIAPTGAVKEMRRLAGEMGKDARVSLTTTPTRIVFEAGDARLISKVIDGTFPDYARILPSEHKTRAVVEAQPLLAALARAATVLDEGRRVVLDFADARCEVSAEDRQGGSARDETEAEIDGPPQRVAINLKYLTEMARAFGGERLLFQISDAGSPLTLRDPASAAGLGVVMPLR